MFNITESMCSLLFREKKEPKEIGLVKRHNRDREGKNPQEMDHKGTIYFIAINKEQKAYTLQTTPPLSTQNSVGMICKVCIFLL